MLSIEDKVIGRIYGKGRGYVFTPKQFLALGSRDSVDQALSSLTEKGTIRRIARGLYDYPKNDPLFGIVAPSPDKIAEALVSVEGSRLQPTGAYAANILGLSEQLPASFVYLTDLDDRSLTVGNRTIVLRRATPRNMKMAGRVSGLVTQAFRHLKKENITPEMISYLSKKLSDREKDILKKDIPFAPAWIAKHFRTIAGSQ